MTIQLYNFYRRYLWNENDFSGWQTGMVDHSRGMFDGLLGAAVMQGFDVAPSGLDLTIGAGVACGPTGYLNVMEDSTELTLTAPSGDFERALVVVRPLLVPNTYIARPTNPFDSVPLKEAQESEVVVIRGAVDPEPEYPATEPNDVILCGLRLNAGQTVITENDIDYEVRDIPGKNSNFQQDQAKYDDRLRPYIFDNQTLGIKPSQLNPPFARVFSYVKKSGPSIYPKDSGGDYNPADSFLNFQTGAITGGDEASANFTPQIPSATNAIIACVGILADDTVSVAYGTEGTRQECFDGVRNQKVAGNGSVSIPASTKPIAFVIAFSDDGVNINEIDIFDARGVFGVGEIAAGVAGGGVVTPTGGEYPLTLTADNDGQVIMVDTTAARTINLPAPTSGFKVTFKDFQGGSESFPITLVPPGGADIEGLAANYVLESAYGSWTLVSNPTDFYFI